MKKAEIKDRIKQAMEIREIRQTELVSRTGIDKGQMSSYLSGKYKPRQKNIDLIAQVLSVDEAWLMGFDVPMERRDDKIKEKSPKIIQYYNQLNDIGKHEAEKRVEELTYLPQYTLGIKAAHNDYASEPGEIEKMREDLTNLKKPD